jgi:hypothetical protein
MQNVQIYCRLFYLLLFLANLTSIHTLAQNVHSLQYQDQIFTGNIKTVQLHVKGWEMSYPVVELGGREELIFSFDDMDGDVKNYQYTIIHCNADWTPSTLFPSDYIDGFYENPVDNYRLSFNTFLSYTHYSLTLPGYNLVLKIPGNYVLKVYEGFDKEKVVVTRRFMVSESTVHIQARVHQPRLTRYHKTSQQVSINILHPELRVYDPHSEFFVTVMQNNRYDNSISDIKPMHIRNNEVSYEDDERLVFDGLNEFRNFDTRSLRYQTEFIKNIDFSGGLYHVELHPSPSRGYARYFSYNDINGRFLIRNDEGRDPAIDADYLMVYFTLPWKTPFDNGNVYIMGALTDWQFYDWSMMYYNPANQSYELAMLLKQGYYNYSIVFLEEGSSKADATVFEGNFYETENDYLIMVYHRAPGTRFDRLVGTRKINSLK